MWFLRRQMIWHKLMKLDSSSQKSFFTIIITKAHASLQTLFWRDASIKSSPKAISRWRTIFFLINNKEFPKNLFWGQWFTYRRGELSMSMCSVAAYIIMHESDEEKSCKYSDFVYRSISAAVVQEEVKELH